MLTKYADIVDIGTQYTHNLWYYCYLAEVDFTIHNGMRNETHNHAIRWTCAHIWACTYCVCGGGGIFLQCIVHILVGAREHWALISINSYCILWDKTHICYLTYVCTCMCHC